MLRPSKRGSRPLPAFAITVATLATLATLATSGTVVYVIEATYEGQSFFECVISWSMLAHSLTALCSTFDFYTGADPTKYECFHTDSRVLNIVSQWYGNVSLTTDLGPR